MYLVPSTRRANTAALIALCLGLAFGCSDEGGISGSAVAQEPTERRSLVALARLEPSSRVVSLGSATTDVLKELLVEEGSEIVEGQILVLLENYALRGAELEAARLKLDRAELRPLDVEAQEARLRAIEAELEYARSEVGSQKGLSEKGFSAGKEFRDAQLRVRRAEEQKKEAEAELRRIEASANLEALEARNQVFQAEARLEQTMIRSPLDGRVLRVLIHEGELVSGRPIIRVGSTQDMYALGEVHANEIRLVVSGQRASFSSPALPAPLDGVVESVGAMIHGNNITGEDPNRPTGMRVVQVRVRLTNDEVTERLTNLEGQLRIFLEAPASR
jgi:HlyD family secretion protein